MDNTVETPSAPSARGLWALGFVAASLVALVVVPTYYGRRVDAARSKISDVLEPATRLSSNLRLLKARQMARVEGFILTGDPSFRVYYNAAIAEEDSVLTELSALAAQIDIGVRERVARVTNESTDWRFYNQRIFENGPDETSRETVRDGYDALQRATRDLDLAILADVDLQMGKVASQRRIQRWITLALAGIALLATLVVGRVAYRYRALTVERETRRREAVQARREVDALLEATGDGVLGVDLEGKCISLNRAGAKLLGYTEAEITGRDMHDTLFHTLADGDPARREGSLLLRAISEGRPLQSGDDAIMWRRKRASFPTRWSLLPMVDGTELRGAVLTFTDMTEIQEKETQLRRAIRQREDVVSIVSHDLRNPLGVALAAADLLLDLPLDEQQRRRQAEIIRRSGQRMQRLIDDLLDVARIEAGALVVRPSQEDLGPILDEAAQHFRSQADSRSIELDVGSAVGDLRARVDRDRVMQALSNLLDNAIRLTPEGGSVTLSASEDGDAVLVSVADTGPGIPADLVDRLFERFTQAEGRAGGAAGLGLTIVQGVVEAHAGEVTFTTEEGRGTTFTLRFPKRGPAAGEEARV